MKFTVLNVRPSTKKKIEEIAEYLSKESGGHYSLVNVTDAIVEKEHKRVFKNVKKA